jgi:hypothetical protein
MGPPLTGVKTERLAGNRGALHDLAFNGEHGAAAGDNRGHRRVTSPRPRTLLLRGGPSSTP